MPQHAQLIQLVSQELEWEPRVDHGRVAVTVDAGVVTLAGSVADYAQKVAAERAAKRISGVRGISNDLSVELPPENKRSDADVARTAREALEWNASIPKGQIVVTATNGHLRLTGTVPHFFQRDAAEAAVTHLRGVRSVLNLVAVAPSVEVDDIKSRILDAFRRNAELDADSVAIDVTNGTVTLSGRVSSWAERHAAEGAVWAAPGVRNVRDDLAVEA